MTTGSGQVFTKHTLSIHAWQTFGKDTSLFSTSSLSWKPAPAMCERLSTGARFLQPSVRSTQTVVRRCLLTGRVQDRKCEAREAKTCERVWCFSKYLARGWGHSGCLRDPRFQAEGWESISPVWDRTRVTSHIFSSDFCTKQGTMSTALGSQGVRPLITCSSEHS